MQYTQSVPQMPHNSPIPPMTPDQKRKALLQLVFIGVGWKKYLAYIFLTISACTIVFTVLGDGLRYVFQQRATGVIIGYEDSPSEKGGARISINAEGLPQIARAQFQDRSGSLQQVKSQIALAPSVYELRQPVTIVYPNGQPQKAKIFAWPEFIVEGVIFLFCVLAFFALRLLDLLWSIPFRLYDRVRYPHGR